MENEIKGGLFAGLSAAAMWLGRFPGRITRLEERYDDLRTEIADVKHGTARVETKIDHLTQTVLDRL